MSAPNEDQAAPADRDRRQFIGLVIIVAVLACAVGVFVAKAVWQPQPTPPTVAAARPPAPGPTPPGPALVTNPTKAAGTPPAEQTTGQTSGQAMPAPAPGAPPATPAGAPTAPPTPQPPAFDITTREPIPHSDRKQFIDHMVQWRQEDRDFLAARWDRYASCIDNGDLTRERVKQAFLATPRERFCRKQNLSQAYSHGPHGYLPIGYGVTITSPNVVARMTDRLDPQPSDRCLEIGTGSGYQSAMLSNLSNHVYTIEIIAPLYKETKGIYEKLIPQGYDEYRNIHTKTADGYYGWAEHAPFDKIIVTCAIDHIPPPLLKQLAPQGVMIIPIGPPNAQRVLRVTKSVDAKGKVSLTRDDLYPGAPNSHWVPFTASDGGTHSKGG